MTSFHNPETDVQIKCELSDNMTGSSRLSIRTDGALFEGGLDINKVPDVNDLFSSTSVYSMKTETIDFKTEITHNATINVNEDVENFKIEKSDFDIDVLSSFSPSFDSCDIKPLISSEKSTFGISDVAIKSEARNGGDSPLFDPDFDEIIPDLDDNPSIESIDSEHHQSLQTTSNHRPIVPINPVKPNSMNCISEFERSKLNWQVRGSSFDGIVKTTRVSPNVLDLRNNVATADLGKGKVSKTFKTI